MRGECASDDRHLGNGPYLKTSSNVVRAWTSSACTLMYARLDSVPEMEMYDDAHSPIHNFEITYVVDAQGS